MGMTIKVVNGNHGDDRMSIVMIARMISCLLTERTLQEQKGDYSQLLEKSRHNRLGVHIPLFISVLLSQPHLCVFAMLVSLFQMPFLFLHLECGVVWFRGHCRLC